ncbi:ABC transporter substrate-binding protein [Brachyspira hampsonii 30446]|uniref:ABC transporter substrate-binding protein n=1 Tax=Brachyspira hampsonii 30446 TaxID=1289135 RepID=A0A2U4EUG2_9SPIR|nr:peptide ABC transporter substrate-binding protein [Brachyspira hampsonii]EKV56185.1 ABC transporter substrate-binding protein [Brachyspira hampsonii 30446]OEJ20284.1 peptide ABC transporter substrate-binding protein [Brachyspira hampsonii]
MKTKRIFLSSIISISLAFLIILSSISCSKSKSTNDGIIVNLSVEPKTIDPSLNAQIYGVIYISHVFEGLTVRDRNNKVVPGVAEKWEISPDGKTYTFYLRTNSTWSDGKPVVAEDFVYSWQRQVDPKVASEYSYQHEPVKNAMAITRGEMPVDSLGVKAIDDHTLVVELEAPTAYFLEVAAFPTFAPLRKDIIEQYGDDWTLKPETYIGNGPYIMSERNIDENIIMIKNTNYWNADTIVAEKITFVFMQNGAAAVAGIKDGSLHMAYEPPQQDIPTLMEEGLIQIKPLIATYYYPINVTNEYLKDARVRKALSLAIDRNYIVENVTKGGQKPAGGWVPYAVNDVDGDFRVNGGDFYDISKEGYSNNVEMAKQLLAEAGYPNGEGFPVIEFKTDPGNHVGIFEAVQQMWKEHLNIDSTITQIDNALLGQTLLEKNFMIGRLYWSADYSDPMSMMSLFTSYNTQNNGGYSNKRYDDLIGEAMSTDDNNIRMKAMHEAERILIEEDMGAIPLYFFTEPLLVNPKLRDVVYNPLGFHKFFYAYLEE